MNFIELHIGDWIKNTRGLSMLERGVYMELVLAYYTQEGPFETMADVDAAINAEGLTPPLRKAVDKVVAKKFKRDGERVTHPRCDEEIHRYQQKKPAGEAKRKNDRERQERTRARRAQLFERLRQHGITPAWDTPMEALEAALGNALLEAERAGRGSAGKALDNVPGSATVTAPVADLSRVTGDVTAPRPECDHTAASPQSPVPSNTVEARASLSDPVTGQGDARAPDDAKAKAEEAARAMAAEGLQDVNASDPVLVQLLAAGMTVPELTAAAKAAVAQGKGVGWALARAQGRRQDAAAVQVAPAAPAPAGGLPPGAKDPALEKIEADAKLAVPMPAAVRERARKLREGTAA